MSGCVNVMFQSINIRFTPVEPIRRKLNRLWCILLPYSRRTIKHIHWNRQVKSARTTFKSRRCQKVQR